MEISRIVIRNFKGIEKAELSPIKAINVLIGRNNSGKSSILSCLEFLNQYFKALDRDDKRSIPVPREYFRTGLQESPDLILSVSVTQSAEERKEQFSQAAAAWNKTYTSLQVSPRGIEAQLENDLFSTLTFNFVATGKGHFGMVSISTVCQDTEGNTANVGVANSEHPGGTMTSLRLSHLFMRRRQLGDLYQTIWELGEKVGFDSELTIEYGRTGFRGSDPMFFHHLIAPALEHIKTAFNTAFLVSPYRHAHEKDVSRRSTDLKNDGVNLVQYMHNLALNEHDVFEEIGAFARKIVPEVGRLHPRFTEDQDDTLRLAYDWPDGRMISLENMGGGVEQLLILGCLLIHQRTSCILWEEPESHLHPGAQDVLLNELENRVGESLIFLSTQSPVFIRPSDKIAVHAFRNPDGKSAAGRTLSNDELQEAAAVVGSRPGHLAQADIVLCVEGKTGAAAMKEWLNKWPEKNEVLGYLRLEIQSLNTDEIASEVYLINALQKISPNLVMFVDRDNEPGKVEPKKSRITLQRACSELDIPCIITETRQIEDYFTYDAVYKGLPTNLWTNFQKRYDSNKTIGEQFEHGWKLYNYRVAGAMDWKDVEKREAISQLLAQIKNYAKKLRPDWISESE
jgi:hypothetical protein